MRSISDDVPDLNSAAGAVPGEFMGNLEDSASHQGPFHAGQVRARDTTPIDQRFAEPFNRTARGTGSWPKPRAAWPADGGQNQPPHAPPFRRTVRKVSSG
jgi:hypothetical protein